MPVFWISQGSEYASGSEYNTGSAYVRVTQGSEYASGSEYARVLNFPGLHRVLDIPEYV